MVPYWREIMEGNHIPDSGIDLGAGGHPSVGSGCPKLQGVWVAIRPDDVTRHMLGITSAGPDGLSARWLKSMRPEVTAVILSLVMWCGEFPRHHMESRTVLLAKSADASDPGDFRPISIPSVLVRLLHKILAARLDSTVKIDRRQRCFTECDGCAYNSTELDLALKYANRNYEEVYICLVDARKAFDSVINRVIFKT